MIPKVSVQFTLSAICVNLPALDLVVVYSSEPWACHFLRSTQNISKNLVFSAVPVFMVLGHICQFPLLNLCTGGLLGT